MSKTKIIMIILVVLSVAQYNGLLDRISLKSLQPNFMQTSENSDGNNQSESKVGTIEVSYAECSEGFFKTNLTIALSTANHMEVVHSFKEAREFLKGKEGQPKVMVMFPDATRIKMDEAFCEKSQEDKDQALLAVLQADGD